MTAVSYPARCRIEWSDSRFFIAESVSPGQHRISGGSTSRRRAIAAGEPAPLGGQPVDVRYFKRSRSVAGEVTKTKIVGHDDDDVGVCVGVWGPSGSSAANKVKKPKAIARAERKRVRCTFFLTWAATAGVWFEFDRGKSTQTICFLRTVFQSRGISQTSQDRY